MISPNFQTTKKHQSNIPLSSFQQQNPFSTHTTRSKPLDLDVTFVGGVYPTLTTANKAALALALAEQKSKYPLQSLLLPTSEETTFEKNTYLTLPSSTSLPTTRIQMTITRTNIQTSYSLSLSLFRQQIGLFFNLPPRRFHRSTPIHSADESGRSVYVSSYH